MSEEKFITKEFVKELLPKRKQDSHKGSYGSILNIAGSVNYKGAAFLSSKAALKIGAGYVTLASVEEVINSVSVLCPEVVCFPLKEKDETILWKEYKKIIEILSKYTVIQIGCGISSINRSQKNIEKFTENILKEITDFENPVIIDADGLNIISKLKIKNLPKNTVLTPHAKELSRLLKVDVSEIQNNRKKFAKITAQEYSATVVLKGHQSVITNGKEVFINSTGNSALSKAGTGDVLTGMISGLCSQGSTTFDASLIGVYLHGLAGEIASKDLTEYGLNASELIEYIPQAIKKILVND